jgi:hypothetical protein
MTATRSLAVRVTAACVPAFAAIALTVTAAAACLAGDAGQVRFGPPGSGSPPAVTSHPATASNARPNDSPSAARRPDTQPATVGPGIGAARRPGGQPPSCIHWERPQDWVKDEADVRAAAAGLAVAEASPCRQNPGRPTYVPCWRS